MPNNQVNVCMPTVLVIMNNTQHVHALLDRGSSSSFCPRKLVDTLQIKGFQSTYQLKTLTVRTGHSYVRGARRGRVCIIIHSQSFLTYDMAGDYAVNKLLAFVF